MCLVVYLPFWIYELGLCFILNWMENMQQFMFQTKKTNWDGFSEILSEWEPWWWIKTTKQKKQHFFPYPSLRHYNATKRLNAQTDLARFLNCSDAGRGGEGLGPDFTRAVLGVKHCHKLAMKGNGFHITPIKMVMTGGWCVKLFFNHTNSDSNKN